MFITSFHFFGHYVQFYADFEMFDTYWMFPAIQASNNPTWLVNIYCTKVFTITRTILLIDSDLFIINDSPLTYNSLLAKFYYKDCRVQNITLPWTLIAWHPATSKGMFVVGKWFQIKITSHKSDLYFVSLSFRNINYWR